MVLRRLDRPSEADLFLQRSQTLADLETTIFPLFAAGPTVTALQRAAQLTEEQSRVWEAWGWQVATLSVDPNHEVAKVPRDRLRARLNQDHPPLVLAGTTPVDQVNLAAYPLPAFPPAVRDTITDSALALSR